MSILFGAGPLFGAGLLTPPMAPTAGLNALRETSGHALWLGPETGHSGRPPLFAVVPETGHNEGDIHRLKIRPPSKIINASSRIDVA